MKIDAVAVSSSNLEKTIEFYTLIGFEFGEVHEDDQHIDPKTPEGSARLMIDTKELMTELGGEEPRPSNHSPFAIRYDSPQEVNIVAEKLMKAGFTIVNEPWDAFWGQRYAVVQDPDGYKVDLYAQL